LASRAEKPPAEISWAAQTWATELADLQPLVLVFEDIHWAEEPMLDLIEKVGPGGSFLNQSRSAALCRTEAWVPGVLDRDPYALWEKKGARSTEDLLNERLRKILDTHRASPLSPAALEKIKEILEKAELRERK